MKNYHVILREEGSWVVIKSGATRAASVHQSQASAMAAARLLIEKNPEGHLITEEATTSAPKKEVPKKQIEKGSGLAAQIGERIKRARLMRGLSLRGLAEALDKAISHTTLQKYEKGLSTPDTLALGMLARVFDLSPDYFLASGLKGLECIEYRKLTKLPKKTQHMLQEQAFEFFERYLEIEDFLEIETKPLRPFDLTQESFASACEKIEEITLELRTDWGLGMNAIANIHTTLEEHGVKVKILPAHKGFDGFSAWARASEQKMPVITLSEEPLNATPPDLPRLRFTALHELGHLCLQLPSQLEERDKEKLCHRFASSFLVPMEPFKVDFGGKRSKMSIPELKTIKRKWGISFAATMRRALDLELITQSTYKSYFFIAGKYGFRSKEPQTWAGDEHSNRFQPMVFRALTQGLITSSKACTLLHCSQDELAKEFITTA